MVIIIDPVAFYIGSLGIRWYGVIIAAATLIAMFLINREAAQQGIASDFFLDYFLITIPAAIIAARLYYVVFNFKIYKGNIRRIFAFREGGIAIHGAVLAGLLVLIILSRKRGVSFWQAADIIAPALVLGQSFGRWGNFINREAYGGIVSKEFISIFPDFIERQMHINGYYHHPAFLYESSWDLLVFIFLISIRRKEFIKKGDLFLLYLITYSLGRFFIEGIRTDSLMLGPWRIAQLVSIFAIVLGGLLIYIRHKKLIR
ncbi:prolipoprotein diacylglyceryl transferase [Iocasia frigidifontis]|uniref:Phosphatidylglycerol--prolipoprotein diacylglyceryl transferase n=1 Tax=Iocasia fonsfrigidae TaxID=2682810 RepID=A0A8A7KDG7_9FIRM|nr:MULTISPECIES: prolipoprotein diacylglyceryl transferase [Halanaerobiaceae]AZO95208.1 prolipoprotein diacylglyceryl transferase [Halocella sp. SP3-1]QTL98145.1 prolipoprotein diacylglyceryl transferase [Iocasia fonsfrigidae]